MHSDDFKKLTQKLATAFTYRMTRELISSLPNDSLLRSRLFFPARQALTQSFVIEVARIFDNSKTQNNLTVYNLLGGQYSWSAKHRKTIKALKKMRDKYLMHNDLETCRRFSEFLKKINITPNDVMSLLAEAFRRMEKLRVDGASLRLGIYSMKSIKKRYEGAMNDLSDG